MKNFYLTGLQFFIFFLSIHMLTAQAPSITTATPAASSVEQWGKFEVKLDVTATWVNPYDYDEIRVAATFTGPDGQPKTVDGFFMQDHTITNTQTGALSTVGNGSFKVRFSPDQPGTWTYALAITNASGTGTFAPQTFSVTAPAQDGNGGFVRADQTNYLHLDDGKQYIPVGENIAWQSSNAYVDFTNWLTKLSDNDGNFFRLWQCSWGLGLEWRNGSAGYAGLRKYKQNNAFYTDWLLDNRNWLGGASLSLADLAGAAHISVADYLGGIDWRSHTQTRDWYSGLKSRPSFRPLLSERMEVIAPPAHYDKVDFEA